MNKFHTYCAVVLVALLTSASFLHAMEREGSSADNSCGASDTGQVALKTFSSLERAGWAAKDMIVSSKIAGLVTAASVAPLVYGGAKIFGSDRVKEVLSGGFELLKNKYAGIAALGVGATVLSGHFIQKWRAGSKKQERWNISKSLKNELKKGWIEAKEGDFTLLMEDPEALRVQVQDALLAKFLSPEYGAELINVQDPHALKRFEEWRYWAVEQGRAPRDLEFILNIDDASQEDMSRWHKLLRTKETPGITLFSIGQAHNEESEESLAEQKIRSLEDRLTEGGNMLSWVVNKLKAIEGEKKTAQRDSVLAYLDAFDAQENYAEGRSEKDSNKQEVSKKQFYESAKDFFNTCYGIREVKWGKKARAGFKEFLSRCIDTCENTPDLVTLIITLLAQKGDFDSILEATAEQKIEKGTVINDRWIAEVMRQVSLKTNVQDGEEEEGVLPRVIFTEMDDFKEYQTQAAKNQSDCIRHTKAGESPDLANVFGLPKQKEIFIAGAMKLLADGFAEKDIAIDRQDTQQMSTAFKCFIVTCVRKCNVLPDLAGLLEKLMIFLPDDPDFSKYVDILNRARKTITEDTVIDEAFITKMLAAS